LLGLYGIAAATAPTLSMRRWGASALPASSGDAGFEGPDTVERDAPFVVFGRASAPRLVVVFLVAMSLSS